MGISHPQGQKVFSVCPVYYSNCLSPLPVFSSIFFPSKKTAKIEYHVLLLTCYVTLLKGNWTIFDHNSVLQDGFKVENASEVKVGFAYQVFYNFSFFNSTFTC